MPRISVFYGIVISMRWREHGPPHFHAAYGDAEASIGISPLAVLRSTMMPRQLGLVMEWAALHQGPPVHEFGGQLVGKTRGTTRRGPDEPPEQGIVRSGPVAPRRAPARPTPANSAA